MAIDITPTGMWSEPEPQGPTGLAGFFQQPEFGAEVGERLGLIGEILGRLGSGQGMAGISGQIGAVNERSTKRKTRRQMLQMANRLADKLELSNPDAAMLIRANPEYGMELAGKMAMAPIEFENEMKLSRAKGADEYKRAIDLAREKAGLEAKAKQLLYQQLFGTGTPEAGIGGTEDTSSTAPDTSYDTAQPIPAPMEGGGGEVPIEQGDAGDPNDPNPIGANGVDYSVGLSDGPDAPFQLMMRKRLNDPDLTVTEAFAMKASALNDMTGMGDVLGGISKRQTERDAPKRRVAALEAQAKPFAVAPQGPSLPNDPDQVQANYDAILEQAGVPQAGRAPEEREQLAGSMKASAAAGEDDYASLLKSLATAGEGGEIRLNDGTVIKTGGKLNKPTEYQLKNDAFHLRAQASEPVLNNEKVLGELMSHQRAVSGTLPYAASRMYTSSDFKLGYDAARNFIAVLLRKDSGATVTDHEEDLYWDIFIPTMYDEPKNVAFKKQLRDAAALGIKNGRSEQEVLREGYEKTNQYNAERAAKGEASPTGDLPKQVVPPMEQWAIDAGLTETQWEAMGPKLWFSEDDAEEKK